MRRFEYRCPVCGWQMTEEADMTDLLGPPSCAGSVKKHPHGTVEMRRLYSSFGIVWPKDKRGH